MCFTSVHPLYAWSHTVYCSSKAARTGLLRVLVLVVLVHRTKDSTALGTIPRVRSLESSRDL